MSTSTLLCSDPDQDKNVLMLLEHSERSHWRSHPTENSTLTKDNREGGAPPRGLCPQSKTHLFMQTLLKAGKGVRLNMAVRLKREGSVSLFCEQPLS